MTSVSIPKTMKGVQMKNISAKLTSFTIPKTMKGVQMKNIGGPEVLHYKTDLPVPVPRGGEVLVKNDFIGINYVDVFVALLPFLNLNTSNS
jgi:hypothetical protein